MIDYKVFIPSKSRAGVVSTINYIKNPILVVPDNEVNIYSDKYPDIEILGCDKKGITPTRNWILDNSDTDYIVMIDDDMDGIKLNNRDEIIKDKELLDLLIERMFILTEDWGFKCWGFAQASDRKFYREYSPFSTLAVVTSNIIGIIRTGLRFDENLIVKEDYDYSLQQIYYYRGVLRDNRFYMEVKHYFNKGGCVDYRNERVEIEAVRYLQKKWGSDVVKRADNKNYVRINIPLKGI